MHVLSVQNRHMSAQMLQVTAGPTTGCEEEDKLETTVNELKKSEQQISEVFNSLSSARELVLQAQHAMMGCVRELSSALDHSAMDVMGLIGQTSLNTPNCELAAG